MHKSIIVFAVALSLSSAAFCGEIASANHAPKTTEFIGDAKQRIAKCSYEYDKFLGTTKAASLAWEAESDAAEASANLSGKPVVYPKMKEVTPYHKICADSSKDEFIPTAKIFIKSFKAASSKKSAKDMVAQWITAIDAIGSDAATTENAKFETLANGLMLED